jgi:competence protein ComFC
LLSTVWNGLLDVIYPPRCLVCGAWLESGALCDICVSGFAPLTPPFCTRCGVPIAADSKVCQPCEAGAEPPYDWSQALGQYNGTLRQAIHRLKYDGKTALARPLGTLLAHSLSASPSPLLIDPISSQPLKIDVVLPIPLHPARLRQRGFNQAERIAFFMAQERGWQLDSTSLRRVRRTNTQTALRVAERAANVQGAFAVRDPARLSGRTVLLVDDVLTTSATMKEAARVVKEVGATRVCVIALARG